jgi:hypothetical protein
MKKKTPTKSSTPTLEQHYMNAHDAAAFLSKKLKRSVRVDYISKIPDVRSIKVNASTRLYLREDIEQVKIRQYLKTKTNGSDS